MKMPAFCFLFLISQFYVFCFKFPSQHFFFVIFLFLRTWCEQHSGALSVSDPHFLVLRMIRNLTYVTFSLIKLVRHLRRSHCVKSVQIRIFFWSIFYCIWTEYRKIRTRKNSVFQHFSRSELFSKNRQNFLKSSFLDIQLGSKHPSENFVI